jgi:hypothetical protein
MRFPGSAITQCSHADMLSIQTDETTGDAAFRGGGLADRRSMAGPDRFKEPPTNLLPSLHRDAPAMGATEH